MKDAKTRPARAGHRVPALKPAKERGVPRMALSLNSEDKLRMSIGGDWSAIATAFGASELFLRPCHAAGHLG